MEWNSPWGKGFPGWHTECVVMGIDNLGIPFDIHCGGIDHISIHHTNEIAQAEAAYGRNLANYWMHGDFLVLKEGKMSKSKGNIIILNTIIDKRFSPLAYRYLALNAHYRSRLTFSWKAMESAQNSLNSLYQKISEIKTAKALKRTKQGKEYEKKFLETVNDDLDMPKSLAIMWQLIKDKKVSDNEKYAILLDFDKVLGLNLNKIKKPRISSNIRILAREREKYRKDKNWEKADELRKKAEKMGYIIEDTDEGSKIGKL